MEVTAQQGETKVVQERVECIQGSFFPPHVGGKRFFGGYFPPTLEGSGGEISVFFPPTLEGCGGEISGISPPRGGETEKILRNQTPQISISL